MAPRTNRRERAIRKRVLVVDDSITVRELERQLLEKRQYHVDVAVDGQDGWNALLQRDYDLVVTDVDMPRMDGVHPDAQASSRPALPPPAGHHRFLQRQGRGPPGGSGSRSQPLSDQRKLFRQHLHTSRQRFDRGGDLMRIGIVNDSPLAVQVLRRVLTERTSPPRRLGSGEWDTGHHLLSARPAGLGTDGPHHAANERGSKHDATHHGGKGRVPILIVTASVDGNSPMIFEAMGFGARGCRPYAGLVRFRWGWRRGRASAKNRRLRAARRHTKPPQA